MKKHNFPAIVLGLITVLCAGFTVQAASESVHGTGYRDISQYLPEGMTKSSERIRTRAADRLPASFDPRNSSSWLTPIKNQGETGCCWIFSTLDCAEMSSVKRGIKNSDFALSVWQTVYFNYNRVTDPLGLTEGDTNSANGADIITLGGNNMMAVMTMAQGIAPADEETAPFEQLLKAWDSGKGNVFLPAEKAYQGYRLQESAFVLSNNIEDVKSAILEYGAGAVSYCADGHGKEEYWNEKYSSLYTPLEGSVLNHAVTVVGWDDNFSKENFGTEVPPEDGAWLIKNTWGETWGDNGYFWISYYDKSINNGNNIITFLTIEEVENDEHLYQYDGTVNLSAIYADDVEKTANVFQAQSYEELTDVGFYTFDPDVSYTIEIYRGSRLNGEDPTGGESPLLTQEGKLTTQGYHKIALNAPVKLNEGDYFSIVMKAVTSGSPAAIPMDESVNYGWYCSTASSLPGQSYFLYDGGWIDLYNPDHMMNLRIKAYTEDSSPEITLPSVPDGYDNLAGTDICLQEGETLQLYAKTIPAAQTVLWSVDNADVISVSDNGMISAKSAGNAVLTASFPYDGKTLQTQVSVTVTARTPVIPPAGDDEHLDTSTDRPSSGDLSDTSIKVSSIRLSLDSNKTAPGKRFQLKVSIFPENASKKTVIYTSSNPKYASVDKNGVLRTTKAGAGKKVTITARASDGSGAAATYKIKIQKKAVKKVSFTKKAVSVKAGKKVSLKASVTPRKGTNNSVRYISSNPLYAVVNSKGKVTALKAGKGKKVKITAYSRDGSRKKASITIRIK